MFFAPNPGVLAAGNGGKTTADWNAHITTLATSGTRAWTNNVALAAGAYRTTAEALPGFANMYGSVWSDHAYPNIPPSRLTQHGLPSKAIWDAQAAAGYQIFFRLVSFGDQSSFNALSRNGYTSLSLLPDSAEPAIKCTELIRWDGEKAWKSNPSIASAETEYTW
ncbi:hypothetical protein [uncultured Brevundimonas sp.]|uniref:hypothetical protein n=1 Tax=uncultured Brevundimonas sp. TaxID=213418 RepID=UPI00263566FA|nr:hypothetical protein [uncultured Brevundimonas sp.]